MNKKSDDNLDKNSQKQTPSFLYDEKKKWLKYYFRYFLWRALGFPNSMVKGSYFETVKSKPELNFLGLEERQYIEIIEYQINYSRLIYLLVVIPGLIGLFLSVFYILNLFHSLFTSVSHDFFTSFPHDKILSSFNPFRLIIISVLLIITLFFQVLFQLFCQIAIVYIFFRLLLRLLEYLITENLCIVQIINLNLELTRDDAIYRRDVKSMILFRMEYLARVTMLIPWRYSIGKSNNQKWIQKHFQNISYYIRERRRWLIAPNETTLDDLRRDFRKLAYYYLTGKYGAWEWQSFELPTEVIKQTRFQKIQGTLIRFFGIILPLLIIVSCIVFRSKFPILDEDILKNLFYLCICWLFVSLDITLKLGFIESLTKLITGLKDLSK
ncbi:MAG: hypothetical protein VKL42_23650 [Snowella sp.]|nr:hypothetical protein [Snowella sp.]